MSHGAVGGTDRRGVVAIIPRANRGIAGDAAGRSRTNRDSQGALARAPIPREVIRERKGARGSGGWTDRRGVVVSSSSAYRSVAGDAAGRSRTNRDIQGALARAPIPRDVIRERKGARGTGGYTDRRVGGGPIDGPTAAYRPAMGHHPASRTDRRGVGVSRCRAHRSVAGDGAVWMRLDSDSQGTI